MLQTCKIFAQVDGDPSGNFPFRAAMKIGAGDSDAYLAEWRKADPFEVEGDPDAIADAEAARIDAEYDRGRIKQLIDNDGWA